MNNPNLNDDNQITPDSKENIPDEGLIDEINELSELSVHQIHDEVQKSLEEFEQLYKDINFELKRAKELGKRTDLRKAGVRK